MTKPFRIVSKVIGIMLSCILIGFIIANVYILIMRRTTGKENITVFGFSSAVVLTGSMSDTINPNDMVITKVGDTYSVGDIIMFEANTITVTHRIIDVSDSGYLTKGDANNTADAKAIPKEKVVGKVVAVIPKIGSLILFLTTPLRMLIITLILISVTVFPTFKRTKNT